MPDPVALGELVIAEEDARAARAGALGRRPVPVDTAVTVCGLVQQHAARHPDRVAVVADGARLTYADVVSGVVELRRRLLAAGVGAGDVVAVVAERSAGVPLAFLALEAIGAVYLPVERAWPEARRERILAESAAVAVVTDDDALLADASTSVPRVDVRDVAVDSPAAVRDPAALRTRVEPDDEPRYVIYTSGTSGTPKGAVVEQRGMVNHLHAKASDLGIDEHDRVAFTAPIGFDISIWQMLCPLTVGATLVVVDEATARFPRRLVRALREHAVTVAEVVPTVAGWIAQERPAADGRGLPLRWLLTTGEEIQVKLAATLLDALPGTRLLNAYGPTECSDDVTHHTVTARDVARPRIPIGGPVDNCVLYLLVREGDGWRAAAPGETAELFVGGVCVGRGYLRRPDLTREAFFRDVLDPTSITGRLYRTGDLVRLDDGALTYLARADRQVKVAGVRMELDEIEAVLTRHPAVTECAVALDETSGRVGACVVAAGASIDELRHHARAWLPAAVVPATWTFVDALPRTRNGKIDHKAVRQLTRRD